MKLIAVLGVLFVLASCSDSDMPDNFSVSCPDPDPKWEAIQYSYDFDFDNNIVTERHIMKFGGVITEIFDIKEITPTTINFEKEGETYYFSFDRTHLRIKFMHPPKPVIYYYCKLPQV